MFCSNCGTARSGKFCRNCGADFSKLDQEAAGEISSDLGRVSSGVVTTDYDFNWADEYRYQELLRSREVRELIARSTAQARKGLSAEEFLALCDTAYKPLVGVSLTTVAKIALPIGRGLGIKTGKARVESMSPPIGKVLVATVCSLAKRSQSLKQVHQADNGCIFEAALPSDMWSMDGELLVKVHQVDGQRQVDAVTHIHGQLFDWGKSTKVLEHLFEDLRVPLT